MRAAAGNRRTTAPTAVKRPAALRHAAARAPQSEKRTQMLRANPKGKMQEEGRSKRLAAYFFVIGSKNSASEIPK